MTTQRRAIKLWFTKRRIREVLSIYEKHIAAMEKMENNPTWRQDYNVVLGGYERTLEWYRRILQVELGLS